MKTEPRRRRTFLVTEAKILPSFFIKPQFTGRERRTLADKSWKRGEATQCRAMARSLSPLPLHHSTAVNI
ncbi:hypothetical protein FHS56_000893 [Thermonema lapsum]|uniref:Uncharacterized protein n=1 Tax=Thermonema lapsum TaxID=28195 RepID=A0A846MQ41_9BACT|nr:hypothetical protein [Thermonema lapsum]NIK73407.1 hypothetical protein [Thermonema lapsum]